MLTDGVNTLVLPLQLSNLLGKPAQATALGLLTFVGLLAGALVQPYAGALSDRLRPALARKGFIAIGLVLSLGALAAFAFLPGLLGAALAYIGIQISASVAQAGQQGLIPDLVDETHRGFASGLKGFMDVGGAMIGFVVIGQLLGSGGIKLGLLVVAGVLIGLQLVAALLTPEDRPQPTETRSPPVAPPSIGEPRSQPAFVRALVSRFLFLLGIYATGRFLVYYVADRLALPTSEAVAQAGNILALLALITIVASPLGGWLADRIGRTPLMVAGSVFGAASALLLIFARNEAQMLIFGGLMSLGSAAFSAGNWALFSDIVPRQGSARFFGMANFSTAGAAALAGLVGPVLDVGQGVVPGGGYTILFALAACAFLASSVPLFPLPIKEASNAR
jgi:MFS family permease